MSIEDPNTRQGEGTGMVSPELKSQAKDDMTAVTEQAKHDLEAVSERAKEDVRELGHQASEKVAEAKEQARSFASDQKDLAAGQINGVAAAITRVAEELDGSDQKTVARYARDLASGLSSFGKTVEDRDVDDLMGMAQDFGRRQPVAFLGAAALAGFVASRFALASAHRRDAKAASATAATGTFSDERSSSYSPASATPQSGSQPGTNRMGGM